MPNMALPTCLEWIEEKTDERAAEEFVASVALEHISTIDPINPFSPHSRKCCRAC